MSYRKLESVEMNSQLHAWAGKVADQLDFDIVVTSGIRSARQQAQAMFGIINEGGSLIQVYADDDFARGVNQAFPDLDVATEYIQSYFDRGRGSRHNQARALDFRTTGGSSNRLSESEIAELTDATEILGAFAQREYSPPHLHVTFPVTETGDSKKILWLLAAGGLAWIFLK